MLDRAQRLATVRSTQPVQAADLIHPCLWPAAAVFARWDGAETLHAGAFVDPSRPAAWVVIGERGGGKSSLLASLALSGREVLVDDLVVLTGGDCFAGPRCIDLRPEAAAALNLDLDADTTPVRSTSRRRLALGPCQGRLPVRGFIELVWGERVSITRLPPSQALAILGRHRRIVGLGAGVDQLLELSGMPMLRFARTRAWEGAAAATDVLLEALSAA